MEKVPVIGEDPREQKQDFSKKEKNSDSSIYNLSLDKILDKVEGIKLQFGKHLFKINYINKGKQRFSATYIGETDNKDSNL